MVKLTRCPVCDVSTVRVYYDEMGYGDYPMGGAAIAEIEADCLCRESPLVNRLAYEAAIAEKLDMVLT